MDSQEKKCPVCNTDKFLYMEIVEFEHRRIKCSQCEWTILCDHFGNIIDEAELNKKADEWQ